MLSAVFMLIYAVAAFLRDFVSLSALSVLLSILLPVSSVSSPSWRVSITAWVSAALADSITLGSKASDVELPTASQQSITRSSADIMLFIGAVILSYSCIFVLITDIHSQPPFCYPL